MQARSATGDGLAAEFTLRAAQLALWPLHALMSIPSVLFFAALTAALVYPEKQLYEMDRVLFGLLVVSVATRAVVLREPLLAVGRATWPMIGLTALAVASLLGQPFDKEAWSQVATKFLVPFALFHLAPLVFNEERRFRQFEIFALIILAYLSFTSIAFLAGTDSLIFPRYITDQSLGYHLDRARGPMLQAVANGVSLNMLGLLALHAFHRGSVRGVKMWLLLASVPIAILATMTRSVWLSFAATLAWLAFLSSNRSLRRAGVALLMVAGLALALILTADGRDGAFRDRLQEEGPVDFRAAVYAGSYDMFLARPLLGWGSHQMPGELPRYVSGYHDKMLYPHNTYLELLVEHGIVGLALYLWLMWELWRLRFGSGRTSERHGFLDGEFQRLWPILLMVYWVNAAAVVMSYQFINGLLFAMAGMLAAQRRCEAARI